MVNTNHITQLKAYGEITTSGLIVCPFCFNEDEDAWEYNLNDGDTTEISCPNCDQKMSVECSISIDFTTKKIEVEDGR
jgi:uncharacterized Zn-finger protein